MAQNKIPDHVKAKADAAAAGINNKVQQIPVAETAPVKDAKSVDDWRSMQHQQRATQRIEEKQHALEKHAPDKG